MNSEHNLKFIFNYFEFLAIKGYAKERRKGNFLEGIEY